MAQKLLDRPYISAGVHEVCGERVAQDMRAPFLLLADKREFSGNYPLDLSRRKTMASRGREKRRIRIFC